LRAEFPNPSGLLLPGEFVRAKLFVGELKQGITVPQRAVTLSEKGGSVFVIDAKGQVAPRPVKLGSLVDGNWIVESGLKAGDVVIVSNLQKLRPGVPVTAVNGTKGAKPSAAPKPAATAGAR
jgi:membrane fusion protein (multidrug efflux system)